MMMLDQLDNSMANNPMHRLEPVENFLSFILILQAAYSFARVFYPANAIDYAVD
jgi:hypothetical protein